VGLNFQPIIVEVCCRRGPSTFQLAGLAETAVREARIRLGSALAKLGINLDEYALVVNLAPANVRKSGSGLDLALAVGILKSIGRIPVEIASSCAFFGEVALDGSLRGIPGVLPLLDGARSHRFTEAFVPDDNNNEASHVPDLTVRSASSLHHLLRHLDGSCPIEPLQPQPYVPLDRAVPDLVDVRGQPAAKRALVVAAAGNHHLLLVGPPGSGKSLLARRLPGLLPKLSAIEAMETTKIHSVAGVLDPHAGIVQTPPFRAPHHSVSEVGLVGGGSHPRPGEISLAHNGVLFLDELPEFRRGALESLRQPLEEHEVSIVRARFKASFPSRPLLVAAMNPCPCGNWGNPRAACRCSTTGRLRYLSRISGPLLDRIDLHVVVPPANLQSWRAPQQTSTMQSSQQARRAVESARKLQQERQSQGLVAAPDNARLNLNELERVAEPNPEGRRLLDLAIDREQLSARGYVRVLRIARTLADLDAAITPQAQHIGEALRFRISDLANC
jgi:magnesium chelatase family protein